MMVACMLFLRAQRQSGFRKRATRENVNLLHAAERQSGFRKRATRENVNLLHTGINYLSE